MESEHKETVNDNLIHNDNDGSLSKEILACFRRFWVNEPMKFALYVGFSGLILIVLMSLILEYAYKPQACILCHEMKPAHDTWKNSYHGLIGGGNNDCLGCHVAPGFGSKIKAKLGGMVFLWDHVTGNFEPDIKAELPVFCVRSGCHTDPWKMDRGSKVRVNHALHVSKGYGCVVCHDRIAHSSNPGGKNLPGMKDFCFPCHNDEIASRNNCQFCHIYQDAMLNGNGGEGIPQGDVSSHRLVNLSCIDCHTEGCDPRPVRICLDCHSESYITEYEDKKKWVLQSLKLLEDGIPRLEEAISKSEEMGQDISQLNSIFNLVKEVYTFFKADGSAGSHNIVYSRPLLEDTINRLNYAYLVIEQKKRRMF